MVAEPISNPNDKAENGRGTGKIAAAYERNFEAHLGHSKPYAR